MQSLVSRVSKYHTQRPALNYITSVQPNVSQSGASALHFIGRHSALIILVFLAVIGVLVLDDYGVANDERIQRGITAKALDYILRGDETILRDEDQFYGLVFEMPLLLVERGMKLEKSRDIWLMRHLLTHLFFLIGGFFCYLLTYRIFGNRLLAVLAMLLFLLHPRLYAHSFFNTKDVPFVSLFMICLYLTHRAFGKEKVWWFVILGVVVGLLINLRIMGIVLFWGVIAICVLDLFQASRSIQRKHALTAIGVFVLSGVLTLYAVSPYLWNNPFAGFIDWFLAFSQHPTNLNQLFHGELFRSGLVDPPEYVPVWFAITTPPIIIVLGMIGILAVLLRGLGNPLGVLRDTQLQFGLLLVGCFVLPLVAVIVLSSNVYNGWRQMYFIYAPFCLSAAFGLHWLISVLKMNRMRVGEYGVAGVGIVAVAISMLSIHPHQHLYFNFSVDRYTPEHLRTQYDMDYWGAIYREGLEQILDLYPSSYINTVGALYSHLNNNWSILPEQDQGRVVLERGGNGDFYITNHHEYQISGTVMGMYGPQVYGRKVYNSSVLSVVAVDLSNVDESTAGKYWEHYLSVISDSEAVVQSDWDIYLDDDTLIYIKSPCESSDAEPRFFLHFVPLYPGDLPHHRSLLGHNFDNYDFHFGQRGVMFDGKCMASVDLPDYDVARIRTGQWVSGEGKILWEADYNIFKERLPNLLEELLYRNVVPLARSDFDVYIDKGGLVYFKSACSTDDVDARFFLHVYPVDAKDLRLDQAQSDFWNLDFDFEDRGLIFDGKCLAMMDLPDFDIARMKTGQWNSEQQRYIWEAEFWVAE